MKNFGKGFSLTRPSDARGEAVAQEPWGWVCEDFDRDNGLERELRVGKNRPKDWTDERIAEFGARVFPVFRAHPAPAAVRKPLTDAELERVYDSVKPYNVRLFCEQTDKEQFQIRRFADAILAASPPLGQGRTVTDEVVERAAKELFNIDHGDHFWDSPTFKHERESSYRYARAILTAALSPTQEGA